MHWKQLLQQHCKKVQSHLIRRLCRWCRCLRHPTRAINRLYASRIDNKAVTYSGTDSTVIKAFTQTSNGSLKGTTRAALRVPSRECFVKLSLVGSPLLLSSAFLPYHRVCKLLRPSCTDSFSLDLTPSYLLLHHSTHGRDSMANKRIMSEFHALQYEIKY